MVRKETALCGFTVTFKPQVIITSRDIISPKSITVNTVTSLPHPDFLIHHSSILFNGSFQWYFKYYKIFCVFKMFITFRLNRTCIGSCLHWCVLTLVRAYIGAGLHWFGLTLVRAYIAVCLHWCMLTLVGAYTGACLHSCVLTLVRAYIGGCLHWCVLTLVCAYKSKECWNGNKSVILLKLTQPLISCLDVLIPDLLSITVYHTWEFLDRTD